MKGTQHFFPEETTEFLKETGKITLNV